jgi:hypothetical protein
MNAIAQFRADSCNLLILEDDTCSSMRHGLALQLPML